MERMSMIMSQEEMERFLLVLHTHYNDDAEEFVLALKGFVTAPRLYSVDGPDDPHGDDPR